jgi:hypothetical protein
VTSVARVTNLEVGGSDGTQRTGVFFHLTALA